MAATPRTSLQAREKGMDQPRTRGAVPNLPHARGKSFGSLDEYIEHLEKQGAIDLPYWRKLDPDSYIWVTSRVPAGPSERATRAELMRRYGFSR